MYLHACLRGQCLLQAAFAMSVCIAAYPQVTLKRVAACKLQQLNAFQYFDSICTPTISTLLLASDQEEQPGIGSKIMTALGLGGDGSGDSPGADVPSADASPHSGGGGAGAHAGSRIMAALGLANDVEEQEVSEESEQAGAAAASADAQNVARAADRTASPNDGGNGGGGASHGDYQPVSGGAASSAAGVAPDGGDGGRSGTPTQSAASASTQATGVTSGGKYEWVADLLGESHETSWIAGRLGKAGCPRGMSNVARKVNSLRFRIGFNQQSSALGTGRKAALPDLQRNKPTECTFSDSRPSRCWLLAMACMHVLLLQACNTCKVAVSTGGTFAI